MIAILVLYGALMLSLGALLGFYVGQEHAFDDEPEALEEVTA